MEQLRNWLSAFRTWFLGLDPTRRTWFIVTMALSTALIVGAVNMATYVHMVPLFETTLDPSTSSDVLLYLETKEISYNIERGTDRILVPDGNRDQLRMELRGGGLVDGKGVGMELFEENRFGSTKFVEHVRYVRGLQGEIERQVKGFDAVLGAKVLLSLPEDSLFQEDLVEPSASVYLELRTGRTLSADEGDRIAKLVANAVPRLHESRVAILDSNMRVIHATTESEGDNSIANHLAELKRNHERYYKREIESVLERVVGPGNVVARVNVELDNSQRSKQERKLHGDEAVVIANDVHESSRSGGTAAEGVPGTTANLPELQAGAPPSKGGALSEMSETRETGNYDVPETRMQEATLPGGIVSITAAVLVDGVWTDAAVGGKPASGSAGDDAPRTYAPRTAAELASFTTLVAMSLGISEKAVTVINEPFAQVAMSPAQASLLSMTPGESWAPVMRYGFLFLVLLCTFGFIVRPIMKNVTAPESAADPLLADGAVAGVLPDGTVVGELPGGETLADLIRRVSSGKELVTRDEVALLVSTDLTHSVVTLQAWISQD